ncbi:hypothetical protein FKM82_017097 [Ascaphus truei]
MESSLEAFSGGEEMVCVQRLRSLAPAALRGLIRYNQIHMRNTSGMSAGYTPNHRGDPDNRSLADDFEKFCHANSAPSPYCTG